jgi:alkylmercury lyase
MVSLVRPTRAARDIRAEVCGLGHFFASAEAGADWLAANPDGRLVPVVEDFEISRQTMIEIGWAHTADQAR